MITKDGLIKLAKDVIGTKIRGDLVDLVITESGYDEKLNRVWFKASNSKNQNVINGILFQGDEK